MPPLRVRRLCLHGLSAHAWNRYGKGGWWGGNMDVPELPVKGGDEISVLAGAFIALGALFFIVVVTDSGLGFGVTRLLGGLAQPIPEPPPALKPKAKKTGCCVQPEPEQPRSYADLTRLRSLLHWAPSLSLEEGINLTVRDLRAAG